MISSVCPPKTPTARAQATARSELALEKHTSYRVAYYELRIKQASRQCDFLRQKKRTSFRVHACRSQYLLIHAVVLHQPLQSALKVL